MIHVLREGSAQAGAVLAPIGARQDVGRPKSRPALWTPMAAATKDKTGRDGTRRGYDDPGPSARRPRGARRNASAPDDRRKDEAAVERVLEKVPRILSGSRLTGEDDFHIRVSWDEPLPRPPDQRPATSPMMMIAGGRTSSASIAFASWTRLVRITRSLASEPSAMTAAGWSASRPPATRASAISPAF